MLLRHTFVRHSGAARRFHSYTWFCRFEDYVGQLQAATAVAGLSVEKGHTVGIKDRKDIAAIQEVCLHLLALVAHLGAVFSKVTLVLLYGMVLICVLHPTMADLGTG